MKLPLQRKETNFFFQQLQIFRDTVPLRNNLAKLLFSEANTGDIGGHDSHHSGQRE